MPVIKTSREEIVKKATALFAAKGFHACSMMDLATYVGINKASIYHYFSSKEMLLELVIEEAVRNENKFTYPLATHKKLKDFKKAAFDYYTADPGRLILVTIMGCGSSFMHETYPAAIGLIIKHYHDFIDILKITLLDTEHCSDQEAQDKASSILTELHGALLISRVTGSTASIERWMNK